MNQTVRYIIFIAVSLAIIQAWQAYEQKVNPRPLHPPGASSSVDAGGAPAAPAPEAAAARQPGSPPSAPPSVQPDETPGPLQTQDTELWTAEFSPRGGGLSSFILKGRKQQERARPGAEREGVNLVQTRLGEALPLSTDLALPGGFGLSSTYQFVPGQGTNELVFQRSRGSVTVTKRYSWNPSSYVLHLQITVVGAPAGPRPVRTIDTAFEPPAAERHWWNLGPRPEIHQTACLISGERSVERRAFTDNKPEEELKGTPSFTGIDYKYFLAALSPGKDPATSSCAIGAPKEPWSAVGDQQATLTRTLTATPGTPAITELEVYLGPKDSAALAAADHDLAKSVDLGFFEIIARWFIQPILRLFQKLVGNWGVSIILLTLLVKLMTLPLTHRQMKSMEEGRRLAPEVEKIKEKFAGDQQRIQVETMKMYKEHNYQPLAGCVPMLIQLPVWYALYQALSSSFELYNEPFIHGWINDLTAIDPYYITPVLMTVTMILTQLLTPQAAAPTPEMKYITYAMPVFFGFFMLSLPSGLVLYIFTNNLLSIAQSLWFRRKFPQSRAPAN